LWFSKISWNIPFVSYFMQKIVGHLDLLTFFVCLISSYFSCELGYYDALAKLVELLRRAGKLSEGQKYLDQVHCFSSVYSLM